MIEMEILRGQRDIGVEEFFGKAPFQRDDVAVRQREIIGQQERRMGLGRTGQSQTQT